MKNRTLLAAIATAAVVAIAAPSTSHAQVPQTSKGEVATLPSFATLITAINASSAQAEKLKGLTTLTAENVQFVDAAELVKGNSEEALTAALEKNKTDIDSLRSTLGAATSPLGTIMTANTALELKPEHVIATDVGADGKVVVYYWKKTS